MKKEDILEASRKENNKKDLALIETEHKGTIIAAISILILSTVYFCLEIFVKGETNYGWYSIIALYCAIVYGYRGIKAHKKLSIFTSIIWLIVSFIMIYSYISNIFATSNIL